MAPLPKLGEPDENFHNLWVDDDEEEAERLPPHPGFHKWTVRKPHGRKKARAWREFRSTIPGDGSNSFYCHEAQEDVMHGFNFAVSSMLPGERAVFTIPPELAVTKAGSPASIPSNIPPNQKLWFKIELINLFTITDLFEDQGILKKTIKIQVPERRSFNWRDADYSVFVKYNACLKDGTSVSKSEGVEFRLADSFFCPAISLAVKTMKGGDEAILIVKPKYAFGELGRPSIGDEAVVPPDATIYVYVQFVSWTRHTREEWTISKEDLSVGNSRLIHTHSLEGWNINGPDEAVTATEEGEVASIIIPPQHAIGAVGSNQYRLAFGPPIIPRTTTSISMLFFTGIIWYLLMTLAAVLRAVCLLASSLVPKRHAHADVRCVMELQSGYCPKRKRKHRYGGAVFFVPGVASQAASTPPAAAATPATSATANRNAAQISSGTVKTVRGFRFMCFGQSRTK